MGVDVVNLFYTSSAHNVQEQEWDKLVQHYHNELVNNLKKLNYNLYVPTITDIHTEILQHSMHSVGMSMLAHALQQLDDTTNADISSLFLDTEVAIDFRKKLSQLPKYNEIMKYLLNYYDRKGYLD